MTQILNVTRNEDGQYQVSDASGHLVDGPFETNAAAWRALDRLDHENNAPPKMPKNKKVLWGKPEQAKKGEKGKKARRRDKQAQPKQEHRLKVNAAKAPGWIRGVAAAKFDPAGQRKYRDDKLGTFGAASPVKRIDPAEYLAAKARGEA
ncbi:hypothetical protein M0654_03605 [Rhizobium sp. NTR19]|uniref:Uncharacterized protein n=1 Tax=Neorhizobium turbinariae TaxID=2937795 RepID=A0ABT0IMG0_9HYPH|nr:hypothetical protein [Neorhizobium turbinariae]MCK8779065.1 hypothetical protein [Neorhizobium turbinariae]